MGGIIAASMIAGRCLAPLGQVAGLLMQYQNARTSAGLDRQLYEAADRTPRRGRVPAPPGLPWRAGIPRRHLRLPRQLAAGAEEGVVQDQAGRKVGIIGRIGSGKTTLEKLALALYKPHRGRRAAGRRGRAPDRSGRRAPRHRPRAAGSAAVLWQPQAQPGHGRALCGRRQHPGRGQPGRRVRVRQPASQWLRHADRRARRVLVRRPAPVGGRGPRADQRPAHPAAR